VALLVFGPKRLPELARNMGKGMGRLRRALFEVKDEFQREMELEELKELRKDMEIPELRELSKELSSELTLQEPKKDGPDKG
jgi:sec-independent protein translocase protein TatB